MKNNWIKSPLNYIGGKYKILNQVLPLFPKQIDTFVDLFAGGCNVGININANLTYLINLFDEFKNNDINFVLKHIDNRIDEFSPDFPKAPQLNFSKTPKIKDKLS